MKKKAVVVWLDKDWNPTKVKEKAKYLSVHVDGERGFVSEITGWR